VCSVQFVIYISPTEACLQLTFQSAELWVRKTVLKQIPISKLTGPQ